MINQVMQGPDWDSTAIFLAWDDWGGFYDHLNPPTSSANGFGLRVPSLLISPYAKQGYIDHGVYSFDSYQKFIEDVFLGGSRLDPTTDGRPDPRPVVAENYPGLADLADDFDFTQEPRPPFIIGNNDIDAVAAPVHPSAGAPPASGPTLPAAGTARARCSILPPPEAARLRRPAARRARHRSRSSSTRGEHGLRAPRSRNGGSRTETAEASGTGPPTAVITHRTCARPPIPPG